MNLRLERLVWRRAGRVCEYCQMPQEYDDLPFQIDHIIARKHDGPTTARNLALACFLCNNHKGPNIAGRDPRTGRIVRLFHPRRHQWQQHFLWDGPRLVGLTAIGRPALIIVSAIVEQKEPRIFTDTTDFHGLSVLIRRIRENPQFLSSVLVAETMIRAGRATIAVLEINLPHRIALRQALIEEGLFPPVVAEKPSAPNRRNPKRIPGSFKR